MATSPKHAQANENPGVPGFAEHLRDLRGERTRAEIADAARISENYIAQLESGRRTPSVRLAKTLADVLGLNSEDRDAFLSLAMGLNTAVASSKVPKHALARSVDRFLGLTRSEGASTEAYQDILRELVGHLASAGVARGVDREARASARGLELLASALDPDMCGATTTSHEKRMRVYKRQILELMAHLADGTVPLDRRIALLKKINNELGSDH